MGLLSDLKVSAAKAADWYSVRADPWEPFKRPSLLKTFRSLKDREAECWSDLQSFWYFNELIIHRQPMDRIPPALDLGDQATWHGVYLAALSLKYSRAKSDGLAQLIANALNGCYQHQYFHGEGRARLIRGYDRRSNNAWQDDASNDSLTGHFAGLYFALKFGPKDLRGKALSLIQGVAQELIDHDLCLVKADGTPTTYGKLIDGVKTDPLQMTLALAMLTVAELYGVCAGAAGLRDKISTRYGAMIPYPKMRLGTIENWNDDHRAAIHLAILAMESPRGSPMQDSAYAGLLRLWKLSRERANIWVNGLIALGLGESLPLGTQAEMERQARIVLSEYELQEKRFDTAVDWTGTLSASGKTWSGRTVVGADGIAWAPQIITIAGSPRARQPLPAWACGKQDFIWQRHRYSCRDWLDHTEPTQRFNGGDYLAAYWVSVAAGLLTGKE